MQFANAANGRLIVGAWLFVAAFSVAAEPVPIEPAGDVFVVSQSQIASGGGFVSNPCYRLLSSIGEAVVGTVADAEFTLTAGFLADAPSTDDKLFRSGFETSTGECKP